ncbi:glycosyltransferase family 4 protein [Actinomyces howellii]|uniref:GDP-mannose-dependent alpha-(1-6)-phosphatidylinositol monomannoside mannosyltransferase n=1 Tax=Actinomyces howellii TaxID=52771 RepID=A0A448HCW6_9ACTO|nr:glycosyltransferase family 4 protein [Actinomyces howellii]VEG25630.1 GDP-mannose-dependent alpha-(1-6)-phosphatidylinositol monomannoside mannosyltransferase [Actinomyces howellii]
MRIAYVCADPGVPVFGTKGASVHIQEVVRELRAAGHRVVVHAARRGETVPSDLTDLEVIETPVPRAEPEERERLQRRASIEIAQAVVASGTDLVYERYSLFSTALAEIHAATRAPGVLEVNAPLIEEQRDHRVLVDQAGALRALRTQVGAARATVCVSEPVAQWVRALTGSPRVSTVPNGVSLSRITPAPEDPDRVVVTFVGTLKPWHGVEDLLEAAALAREGWHLRIVGDGPEMAALRSRSEALGLAVDFRGAVPPEQVPAHLAGSAVGVAPYPDLGGQERQYFSPLKVLEYLAAGLPVIASGVGQLPELLDGLGVLVPPSRPDLLAAAIDELASDPHRRATLGRASRERAEQRHGWDRVVTTILGHAGVDDDA